MVNPLGTGIDVAFHALDKTLNREDDAIQSNNSISIAERQLILSKRINEITSSPALVRDSDGNKH